jgi:hypothetical protein
MYQVRFLLQKYLGVAEGHVAQRQARQLRPWQTDVFGGTEIKDGRA